MSPALEREAIFPRVDGIRKNIAKLRTLCARPLEQFMVEDTYALVQHYLRLSLEGVFHIGSHILSRLPGGRVVEYKGIARALGTTTVVPNEFAARALVPMAGLRNLLVHEYSDIEPQRLRQILQNHLSDVELFLQHL